MLGEVGESLDKIKLAVNNCWNWVIGMWGGSLHYFIYSIYVDLKFL